MTQHLRAALREHCPQICAEEVELEAWARDEPPYRGLAYFDLQHAAVFHGRAVATQSVVTQLEEQARAAKAFVLVLGASGSGKSSLLRGGVLHALVQQSRIAGVDHWRYAVFRPSEASDGELSCGLYSARSKYRFPATLKYCKNSQTN